MTLWFLQESNDCCLGKQEVHSVGLFEYSVLQSSDVFCVSFAWTRKEARNRIIVYNFGSKKLEDRASTELLWRIFDWKENWKKRNMWIECESFCCLLALLRFRKSWVSKIIELCTFSGSIGIWWCGCDTSIPLAAQEERFPIQRLWWKATARCNLNEKSERRILPC